MGDEEKERKHKGVNRREFIKTVAVGGAALSLGSAAALKPSETFAAEKQTDIVVIGAGAGGLCAALTAGLKGASVMVFEKMKRPGGMTNYSRDMFGVGSNLQKNMGIKVSVEEAFKRHMIGSQWLADARLVRAFMDRSGETIDWLQEMGVKYHTVETYSPDAIGALEVSHVFKGLAMTAMVKPLFQRAKEEKNIQVFQKTPVKRILMDGGRVAGVVAEDPEGNQFRVSAKAVIVASGGYQDNKEWLEKYCEGGRNIGAVIPSQQVGGPIQMAWDVGAAPDGMGVLMNAVCVKKEIGFRSQLFYSAYQPYLWINKSGERFCDESIYKDFTFAGNALAGQSDATGFCIFDEQTKSYMRDNDIKVDLLPRTIMKLTDIDSEMERGVKEGKVFRAGSLEELAEKIGVNTEAFHATIDEYNACYDRKHDFVYGKEPNHLRSIREPNFHAIKLGVRALISCGGIKINHRTEVLNGKHQVIPGLYAVGMCAGGLTGTTYLVSSTGAALGFTSTSGRMAGERALKYVGV